MDLTPAVLCLSASGQATARQVAAALGAPLHARTGRATGEIAFPDTREHVATLFAAGVPVVGVCAAGILIRAVAPLLATKAEEPPVVAVAEDGSAVVPLLGGHRGANALAARIAAALGIRAAVTTAGDLASGIALDAPPPGWRLANPEDAKAAMAAHLSGAPLRAEGEAVFASLSPSVATNLAQVGTVALLGTEAPAAGGSARLVYHPQRFVLGLGAARGAPAAEVESLARAALDEASIAPGALAAVATLDLKADEAGILSTAAALGAPLRLFSAGELEALTPRLATPSEVVFAEVGCHGVAEAAALAAAGADAVLALPKRKSAAATAALARAPAPILAPAGRPRGRLAIVGIGPGQAAWRTPEASRLVAEAEELVGYGLYLDLLGPLAKGKLRTEFALGQETERCRHALERAGEGRRVALVSSGDAGIYAMAALVWELVDGGAVSDAARRTEIVTAPGISAFQAAAARIGAPLGHDFCAISLSDLMTPREAILARIRAAAEGDFVTAFYNPVSQRRRTLLAEARDLLLAHRPAETPVVLARSLGRPEERVEVIALKDLVPALADMLTVVIVGSSESRRIETGAGPRVYTPRGYARKAP